MKARSSALRRRRKPSLGTRLRTFWVFILVIVAAAGYAGYVLVTLPQLRVGRIDIRIAGGTVRSGAVARAAAVDRHGNLWLMNTSAIAQRIEAIPYVDKAEVRRVPPANLVINVTERVPAACVRSGARNVTVDDAQRILQTGCARATAMHILLHDGRLGSPGTYAQVAVLSTLLADGRALHNADLGVHSIAQDRFGQLVAVGPDGIQYLFGNDADLAAKARLVAPVLAATQPGHAIRAIDLRAPLTPTVQYR